MKMLLAILIFIAAPCYAQELELRGNPHSSIEVWHKHGVYLGDGVALTTHHGDTGHETVAMYAPMDWRIVLVPEQKVRAAIMYQGHVKPGQPLWNRGKWGQATFVFDDGTFHTTHPVIRGDSGSGMYDKHGRCVGIVTHKTATGSRCVNPYFRN